MTLSTGGSAEPDTTYQIAKDKEIYPLENFVIHVDAVACWKIIETYENAMW